MAVLAVFSVAFVLSFFNALADGLALGMFLVLGYVAILHVRLNKNSLLASAWVACLVLIFGWLRHYSILSFLPNTPWSFATIGLSYILFRVIQLIVDTSQAEGKLDVGVISYLNFTCNFLSFISGPIDRFQSFSESCRKPEELNRAEAQSALCRIVFGYVKILIISAAANYLFENIEPQILENTVLGWPKFVVFFAICCASYIVYLYYNFSGYMDVMIGVGLLAGLRLPENFDRPFSSRSALEFWGRWHMTLSGWFKAYMFNPLLAALMKRWPSAQAARWLGVFCYFVVFLVMGVWHGSTSIFLLYGVVLGASVALNKLWQELLILRLGHKGYRALAKKRLYGVIGQGLTAGYFAVALTAFWITAKDLAGLAAHLGWLGLLLTVLGLSAAWSALGFLSGPVWQWLGALPKRADARPRSTWATSLGLAALVLSCVAVQSILNKPPEFVYAKF